MTINFPRSLAHAADFPKPRVFAAPRLSTKFLTLEQDSALDRRELLLTSSGRNAIGLAAQLMRKSDRRNRILVPAYHCPALIEPFLWQGYDIVFYPVEPDLSTDIEKLSDIAARSQATHGVVLRFFGFAQNAERVLETMRGLGLSVLEDCAHALFEFLDERTDADRPSADYQICSLNKFLPTTEGGALRPVNGDRIALTNRGLVDMAKSLAQLRTLNRPGPQNASSAAEQKRRKQRSMRPNWSQQEKTYRYFDPETATGRAFPQTRWLFNHADLKAIATARQSAFTYLSQALAHSPLGKPLYGSLNGCVPYVFPFLLDDERHFRSLRMSGLQILRWEELAETECPVSREYRRRLVQVPCHQDLSNEDLAYISSIFTDSRTR